MHWLGCHTPVWGGQNLLVSPILHLKPVQQAQPLIAPLLPCSCCHL
jgi:hypothetical protein